VNPDVFVDLGNMEVLGHLIPGTMVTRLRRCVFFKIHILDNEWALKKQFVPSDGQTGDRFGWDVELNSEFAIISADWANVDGFVNSGAVYIYSDHPTSLEGLLKNPDFFELFQNSPNPFNPVTKITYNLY